MKRFLSSFVLLFSIATQAGLPPTTLSGQGSTTKPTTFGIQVPYKQATSLGGVNSLIETGNSNVIADASNEAIVSPWATYYESASATPVAGTGNTAGSNTISKANDATTPLDGAKSLLLTKTAVNSIGQGISIPFTIPDIMKGKVLQFNFNYKILSGTYADNDMACWVYDVTNAVLIQPSAYQIKNSGIIERQLMEFQSSINSGSYRAICHIASVSALAYSIQFDSFFIGTQAKSFGSAVTDWVSYTPTVSGFGTSPTVTGFWRRVGKNIECQIGVAVTNVTGASTLAVSAPSQFVLDTSSITSPQSGSYKLGTVQASNTSTGATYIGILYGGNLSSVSAYGTGGSTAWNATVPLTLATSTIYNFTIEAPIVGWSSSQIMSSDADTRVVATYAYKIAGNQTTSGSMQDITGWTIVKDSHGSFNATTGVYTALSPGTFKVYGQLAFAASTAGSNRYGQIVKNGAFVSYAQQQLSSTAISTVCPFSAQIDAVTGDTFKIQGVQFSGGSLAYDVNSTQLFIEKLTGPSQIAASESVSALYTGAPPTIVSGTLAAGTAIISFGTKVKDSHSQYNSSNGQYLIVTSGVYDISASIMLTGTHVLNSLGQIYITIDGTSKYTGTQSAGGAVTYLSPTVNVRAVPLLSGQIVTIKALNNGTGAGFLSDATLNFFSITRTGNY